jgi:hypothetical protein
MRGLSRQSPSLQSLQADCCHLAGTLSRVAFRLQTIQSGEFVAMLS